MADAKSTKKPAKSAQNALILKKQIHQFHVDLKRGLLPYIIMFFLKTRPHYSLEIFKKMAHLDDEQFKIRQNIVYQNLKKFEQKGMVDSYYEKSSVGAKRKYYYLTELGEEVFEEIVEHIVHAFSQQTPRPACTIDSSDKPVYFHDTPSLSADIRFGFSEFLYLVFCKIRAIQKLNINLFFRAFLAFSA